MDTAKRTLNLVMLTGLAPILVGIGCINFFLPAYINWINTSLYTNIFFIIAGIIGSVLVIKKSDANAKRFNLVLGMTFLSFVIANFAGLYPATIVEWTSLDDSVHLIMSTSLILVGIHGQKKQEISSIPYINL